MLIIWWTEEGQGEIDQFVTEFAAFQKTIEKELSTGQLFHNIVRILRIHRMKGCTRNLRYWPNQWYITIAYPFPNSLHPILGSLSPDASAYHIGYLPMSKVKWTCIHTCLCCLVSLGFSISLTNSILLGIDDVLKLSKQKHGWVIFTEGGCRY